MKLIQVGVGKMGQHWLGLLADVEHAELVAVVEPVPALREAAIDRAGVSADQSYDSVDAALAGVEFDAAVIVTPPPTHRPLAEQLLRAGKDVLMEKPLATTLEDARSLVEISAETGRLLMVGQNYRYFQAFQTVRSLVHAGQIGSLRAVNIQFHKDARTMFGEGDFRYSMPNVLLVDMSIHHFDMLRAITGSNATRVSAQSWHVPDGNFQYDAAASALIAMENGVAVTYTGNWATYSPETSWNGDWEIVGETGRIAWTGGDWSEARVTIQAWGEEPTVVEPEPMAKGGQAALLDVFINAVTTSATPETAAADNIHSLAIVFAAVESVETGRVVDIS